MVVAFHSLGTLRGMEVAQVVHALSLQVLVIAVLVFLNTAGLHFQIYLRAIVNLAVHVKANGLFVRVIRRNLVVANLNPHDSALNNGGNGVSQI